MKLLPHSHPRRAISEKKAAGLFVFLALIMSAGAAGEGVGVPTAQDAINMIDADELVFFAIVGTDEEEGSQAAPPTAVSEAPVPDSAKRVTELLAELAGDEPDLGFLDMVAYSARIESDPETPDNVEAYVSRARLFTERGLYDLAIEDLLTALDLDVDSQAAWYALGRAQEMKGEFEMAEAAYEDAIDLGPDTELGVAAQWDRQMLKYVPQDDRRETLEALGMPDAFTLVMFSAEPGSPSISRHETWYYYRAGTRFDFVDGAVAAAEDIEDVDFETVEGIFTPYRPYQFLLGLDIEDVSDIISEDDYLLYQLGENPLKDGELVYTRQLALGFKNGALFYVRAFPLFTAE